MKYIRTKDGRIYQVYDKVFEYKGDKRYQLVDSRFEISLNDVVKQADTIQDLCDEFIIEYTEKFKRDQGPSRFQRPRRSMPYDLAKENLKIIKTLHAAIWTTGPHNEPILKSVAKLNKKTGELELL